MSKTSERIFNIEEQSWCSGRNFLGTISSEEVIPLVVYVSPFNSNIALEVTYSNRVSETIEVVHDLTFLDEFLEKLRLWKQNRITKISLILINRDGFSKNLPPMKIVVRYRTNEIQPPQQMVVPDGKIIYR